MKLMPVHVIVIVIVLCFVFPISTGYSLITLGVTAAETRPWTYIAGGILIGAGGIVVIAMLVLAARAKTTAIEVTASGPTRPASVVATVAAVRPAQVSDSPASLASRAKTAAIEVTASGPTRPASVVATVAAVRPAQVSDSPASLAAKAKTTAIGLTATGSARPASAPVTVAAVRTAQVTGSSAVRGHKLVFFIGIVFCLVGLFHIVGGITGSVDGSHPLIIVAAGSFFLLTGLLACGAGLHQPAVLQGLPAGQTWVVVEPQQTGVGMFVYWLYTGALATLMLGGWGAVLNSTEPLQWYVWPVLIFFTAFLPLLLHKGIHPTLGQLRYGRVPLRVYINPSVIERIFRAKMQLPRKFAGSKVSSKLVCRKLTWRKVPAGKGRDRMELSGTPLWQTNHHFRANHNGIVELLLKVPPEWPATSGSEDMDFRQADLDKIFIAWRLEVQATVPGIDLFRDYEVPVTIAP